MTDSLIPAKVLSEILDRVSVGLFVLSRDARVLAANRSVEWMTGVSPEKALGAPCRDVLGRVLCGGQCSFSEEVLSCSETIVSDLTLAAENEEKRSITKVVTPVPGQNGHEGFFLVLLMDQSAFKDLIRRVRHEDKRLKLVLDNLDSGVLTVDRGGYITFFNAVAESLTGYSRSDMLGKPFAELFPSDAEKQAELLRETVADGKARSGGEGALRTAEGRLVPVKTRHTALKNEEGRIVGGLTVLSDLSLVYQLDSAIKERWTFYDMVGRDPAMQKIFSIVPVIAQSDATVLVEGSTGTGKDLLAKVIHNASARTGKPLVKVNCAALPDNLLESEMFGYVKGAFTGAERDKPGRFQEADGGSIFLDEIGDMPLSLQAKLLRVLEEKEFYPLGGRKLVHVDVRIISATNRGLSHMVHEKKFREDLFYRLNVLRLEIPALQDRPADIPLLIAHIVKRLSAVHKTGPVRISENAMEILLNHDYPGNVREMENILEHALIICQGGEVEMRHLPLYLQKDAPRIREQAPAEGQARDAVQKAERDALVEALRKHNGNRGEAAKALGMDRTTLWRKMKRHGIQF
ncbi:MAG: sigma 54-interacting transcriptional regulator [Thermodesulfobacteriota bacterium]